jgi:hypothetical protein
MKIKMKNNKAEENILKKFFEKKRLLLPFRKVELAFERISNHNVARRLK